MLPALSEQILELDLLTIEPKVAIPAFPDTVLYSNRELTTELLSYASDPNYSYFVAGFLSTILHYGEYNKATKDQQPRNTPQYKSDTSHVSTLQTLAFLLPEYAERAKCYGKTRKNNQATVIVSGIENYLVGEVGDCYQKSSQILTEVLEVGDININLATLSGILATGRGVFRVVDPTKHDPKGDIRVQFDFNEGSILHYILNKINSENIKNRSDREGLRFNIVGDEALDLCKTLLQICPPLAIIRPEVLLIVNHYESASPSQLFKAYKKLMGTFYYPRKNN